MPNFVSCTIPHTAQITNHKWLITSLSSASPSSLFFFFQVCPCFSWICTRLCLTWFCFFFSFFFFWTEMKTESCFLKVFSHFTYSYVCFFVYAATFPWQSFLWFFFFFCSCIDGWICGSSNCFAEKMPRNVIR